MARSVPFNLYLADEMRPTVVIRSRRHKVSAPRVTVEGNRPELLGPLTDRERRELALDVSELLDEGATFGPPADDRNCPESGPCLATSCRHHLAVDVEGDRLRLTFPGRDVDEIPETCSLRVARRAEAAKDDASDPWEPAMTCAEVGRYVNLSEEGTRLVVQQALGKMRAGLRRAGIGLSDKSGAPRRRERG